MIPVRDLLILGKCSANCLLAIKSLHTECDCVCMGEYHGKLIDAEIDDESDWEPDVIRCANCNLGYSPNELKGKSVCVRCGVSYKKRNERFREEIGFRRGFQHGYEAAAQYLGANYEMNKIRHKIADWRFNWKSIGKSSKGYPYLDEPLFAWEPRSEK